MTKTERVIALAKDQAPQCIRTATAVLVGAVIGKIGVPLIPLVGACAAGVAYTRGYRLKLVRPEPKQQPAPEPQAPTEPEPPAL